MWPADLEPDELALVRAFDEANLEPVKDRKSLRQFFIAAVASSFPDEPELRTLEYLENHLNLRERAIRDLAKRLDELLDEHYSTQGAGGRSLVRLVLNTLDRGQPTEAEKNSRYRITFETNGKCHRFGLRNLFRPHFQSTRGTALIRSDNRTVGEALLRQTLEDALLADGKACTEEARFRVPFPMKEPRDLIVFGSPAGVDIPTRLAAATRADKGDRVYLNIVRVRTKRNSAITVVEAACSEAYEGFNAMLRSETSMLAFFDRMPSQRRLLGDEFRLLVSFALDEDRELLTNEARIEDWAGIEEESPVPALPKPVESDFSVPRYQIHKPARKVARP